MLLKTTVKNKKTIIRGFSRSRSRSGGIAGFTEQRTAFNRAQSTILQFCVQRALKTH